MPTTTLLLANMGGPSAPADVEPYLRAIFADPAILPVPGLIRGPLGRWIARRRAPKVTDRYALIGGRSPLLEWTRLQVERTEAELAEAEASVEVTHAFRYTSPTIEQAVARAAEGGAKRILLLPLFPHHTDAMTGSIERVARQAAAAADVDLTVIGAWGARKQVLALWGRMLDDALEEAGADARVLFVAHGIPLRSVRRGEDYPERVLDTARALAARLDPSTDWSLAFQSRVGPIRWTEPYLEAELTRLGRSPRPVVLMPLSFVADCLETRYDLDHVAAAELQEAGVSQVVRVPAFNDDPAFGRILAELGIEALATAEPLASAGGPAHQSGSGGRP